jgi:hypothetical protein
VVAPNWKLRTAREATRSRVVPGEHMSRAELAEEVNTYLWEASNKKRGGASHVCGARCPDRGPGMRSSLGQG